MQKSKRIRAVSQAVLLNQEKAPHFVFFGRNIKKEQSEMDLENKIEAQRKRMEQIERELARVEEKMPDTAINEEADEEENEEE